MAEFSRIEPAELDGNTFQLIGSDWMLITSANDEGPLVCGNDYNTMTASWGGLGVLWGRPVAFIFIRPQRYTFDFAEKNRRVTLSFFDEKYRKALSYCGKYSGRDTNKADACGLSPVFDTNEAGRAVWFNEAKLVIKAEKLYSDMIKYEHFCSPEPLSNYKANDFHKLYVCGIDEILVRKA